MCWRRTGRSLINRINDDSVCGAETYCRDSSGLTPGCQVLIFAKLLPKRGNAVAVVWGAMHMDDLLLELEKRTGLPRAEIVERLATGLPETVNKLTPQGRVPTEAESEHFIIGPDSVELKEPGS